MTFKYFFRVIPLLPIATLLLIGLPQSSSADCDIDPGLQVKGPPLVYKKVDHSVRRHKIFKLLLLLQNNSLLKARIRFTMDALNTLYEWIISNKNEVFYADFERGTTDRRNYNVICSKAIKNNNSAVSLFKNLTTCYFPNSPKEKGAIKCNKTFHTPTLLGCTNTMKSCSLVNFTEIKFFPEPFAIMWISVLPNGSKADQNSQELKIQYDDKKLEVTSCAIEPSCPGTTKTSTNTVNATTNGVETEHDDVKTNHVDSRTIVGITVGLLLIVALVIAAIVVGVAWWKRRSEANVTSKSSTLPEPDC